MNGSAADIRAVLFLCTENICRSPTAEGVFRKRIEDAGVGGIVAADSAGILCSRPGMPPDPRAIEAAVRRGYDISDLRSRPFSRDDLTRFDLVLAMDSANRQQAFRMALPGEVHKLKLVMDFSLRSPGADVPDPYYGGRQGFERVLDMLEEAISGLVQVLTVR
ncbi:MAG: low molecular weight phosphotyrosine protein phosphatase [Burkholderiales bacterium]|nr:low molecular weight phosphotyrosine protein phosphatase [Burkholderiales bacterium]